MASRLGRDSSRRGDSNDADVLLEDWLLIGNKNAVEDSLLQRRDLPEEELEPFLEDSLKFLCEVPDTCRNEKRNLF